MIEKKIFLKTLDEVKTFVNIMSDRDYDIELLSGKYVVNAKSVMGVLSLDLTHPLTMVANTDRDDEMLCEITPYINAAMELVKIKSK